MNRLLLLLLATSFLHFAPMNASAADFDWPQWQGPNRTAISKETGLLKEWPKDGPTLVWEAKALGGGYSTPSVAGGKIYGMSYRDKDEVVWALEEATGKELWVTKIAAKGKAGYNSGSRSSPTVDGELLYVVGLSGDLACLEVATGKIKWQKNLPKDFGGKMMSGWGYCESPLIDGDKVICTPGGKEATLLALNKATGETVWKSEVPDGDGAGYSSVIAAEVHGKREYVQFVRGGVIGVDASDGKFLWRYKHPANKTANCSTPIVHENSVFAASGYGTGGGRADLKKDEDAIKPEEQYFSASMTNHHGGMVLIDGHIYGSGGRGLLCLDFKTGKIQWEDRAPGKGSITAADGHLYYRNEKGPVLLIEATPKKYVEKGQFTPPKASKGDAWPHPVIANGKLYLRDQDVLLCYDLKEKTEEKPKD